MRRSVDRLIASVARLTTRWFFRSVEQQGFDAIPHDRPVLLVANHFNGLVDPVLLVAGLRRLPRFMAKGTLWKVIPPARSCASPGWSLYRAADGDTSGNVSSFARVVAVLGGEARWLCFRRGHDEPRLAEVRTGAARIALAWADGIDDLVIQPVGITTTTRPPSGRVR